MDATTVDGPVTTSPPAQILAWPVLRRWSTPMVPRFSVTPSTPPRKSSSAPCPTAEMTVSTAHLELGPRDRYRRLPARVVFFTQLHADELETGDSPVLDQDPGRCQRGTRNGRPRLQPRRSRLPRQACPRNRGDRRGSPPRPTGARSWLRRWPNCPLRPRRPPCPSPDSRPRDAPAETRSRRNSRSHPHPATLSPALRWAPTASKTASKSVCRFPRLTSCPTRVLQRSSTPRSRMSWISASRIRRGSR